MVTTLRIHLWSIKLQLDQKRQEGSILLLMKIDHPPFYSLPLVVSLSNYRGRENEFPLLSEGVSEFRFL